MIAEELMLHPVNVYHNSVSRYILKFKGFAQVHINQTDLAYFPIIATEKQCS